MPSEPVLKVKSEAVKGAERGMALSDLPDVLGIEERGSGHSGEKCFNLYI